MIPVTPNTLALEEGREAQILRHLVFRDDIVGAFGLADDEFADLRRDVLARLSVFARYH